MRWPEWSMDWIPNLFAQYITPQHPMYYLKDSPVLDGKGNTSLWICFSMLLPTLAEIVHMTLVA